MRKILFFILLLPVISFPQIKTYVNPGIKLGLAFGQEIEFVFGYELSILFHNQDFEYQSWGITLDYDKLAGTKRFHAGVEYLYRAVGIDVGPTIVWNNDVMHPGFSVIPFGGLGVLPYINYTHIKDLDDQIEAGSYIKLFIPLQHENFSLGG